MLNFLIYFTRVNYLEKTFRFKVAVGISLRKLREELIVDGKPMTQNSLNDNILIRYKKTWNSAREESLPNTRLDNLFLISDFFKISLEELFRKVNLITNKEIDQEIKSKVKLKRLYNNLNF